MSHVLLRHFAAGDPRTERLKKRQGRQLRRAVRPNKRLEMWYRAELFGLVELLRKRGADVLSGVRPHFEYAERRRLMGDEQIPDLDALLARAAQAFGNIGGFARRVAAAAAAQNLDSVDDRLAGTILDSVGVDLRRALTTARQAIAEVLAKATDENIALITSIPDEYLARVRAEITSAFETGLRWESLAEKIRYVGDITDSRARLIARDQTSKMTAAFNEARQVDLGIQRYTWATAGDIKVRPEHANLGGTVQRWDSPPVVDGEAVHPGQAINCRCVPLPIIDLDEIIGVAPEAEAA